MRLAIFGDIHGNLPALEAMLADVQQYAPDALLCLGDVTAGGAWPRECVQRLASLDCPVVRGNADEDVLVPPPFVPRGQFPDERQIYDLDEWGRAQLTTHELALIRRYPPTVAQPGLLAFHGSPASCREVIGAGTPAARLDELRAEYGRQPVWVGGHTHAPLLRTLGGWRLLNPGSVGLAGEVRAGRYVNVAQAEYLLLEDGHVTFRRVPYDVRAVQTGILASDMPRRDWWAAEWFA
jgi:predicted phosphodiesterase